MTTRSLLILAALCLGLVAFGTAAMHGWAVTAGLVGMVGLSFLFAIKTDDPDRTVHEILVEDDESSPHYDTEPGPYRDAVV